MTPPKVNTIKVITNRQSLRGFTPGFWKAHECCRTIGSFWKEDWLPFQHIPICWSLVPTHKRAKFSWQELVLRDGGRVCFDHWTQSGYVRPKQWSAYSVVCTVCPKACVIAIAGHQHHRGWGHRHSIKAESSRDRQRCPARRGWNCNHSARNHSHPTDHRSCLVRVKCSTGSSIKRRWWEVGNARAIWRQYAITSLRAQVKSRKPKRWIFWRSTEQHRSCPVRIRNRQLISKESNRVSYRSLCGEWRQIGWIQLDWLAKIKPMMTECEWLFIINALISIVIEWKV